MLEQHNKRWAIKGTTTKTRVDLEPIVEVTDRANEREERTTERTIERFTPVIQGWTSPRVRASASTSSSTAKRHHPSPKAKPGSYF
jgi:hypothetical protein